MPRADFDRLSGLLDSAVHASKEAANPFNLGLDEDATTARNQAWSKLSAALKTPGRLRSLPHGYLDPRAARRWCVDLAAGLGPRAGPAERLMTVVQQEVAPSNLRPE